jgi:hypothetical protein
MLQVTAIHVKMMAEYFVSDIHKVITTLLVKFVLLWLEWTQWCFCSIFFIISCMVLLEQQKVKDRTCQHSCACLQVASFYWWEIFRCLCCALHWKD